MLWSLKRVAGQRPQQGTKSCRMGRNSVLPYVRLSVHPLGIEGLPEEPEGLPGGRVGGQMYGCTEFLPILQDFVPFWDRCHATLIFHNIKEAGQGNRWPHDDFWRLVFLWCQGVVSHRVVTEKWEQMRAHARTDIKEHTVQTGRDQWACWERQAQEKKTKVMYVVESEVEKSSEIRFCQINWQCGLFSLICNWI